MQEKCMKMAEMKADPSFQLKKPKNIGRTVVFASFHVHQIYHSVQLTYSATKGLATCASTYLRRPVWKGLLLGDMPITSYNSKLPTSTTTICLSKWGCCDSDRENGDQFWPLTCCLVMYPSRSMRLGEHKQNCKHQELNLKNPSHFDHCRPKHLKLACRSFASVSTCLSRRPGNWPHEFLSLVGSDQNWKMVTLWIGWTIGFCLGICLE